MTKKIYYIFTLIGSLLLSSCDSYLDIQPVGQVIPNTLAEYRALFTTAYNTALMTEEYAKSEQISQPYYSLMPLPKIL